MDYCEKKYCEGLTLFGECNYIKAVETFIEIYNKGFYKEEIIKNIYSCFITPNKEEFAQNYNTSSLSDKNIVEDLSIDFIPVAEDAFFSYNRIEDSFGDLIYVKNCNDETLQKEFGSILIAGVKAPEKIISAMTKKNWSKIYIIIEQNKYEFYSLFKLPEFEMRYMNDVVLFDGKDEFIEYFNDNNQYLPKSVISNDNEKYIKIIDEIHKKRIEDINKKRNNVFLSICIPTYNRGEIALKSVNNLLKLKYDSEIEIVISNNGSVDNTKGYEEIKKIKDNRIRYYEFEENQGYASNVRNVLKEARGRFAVVASDEDLMLIQNLGQYMTYLFNNLDAGIVLSTGYGKNFADVPEQTYKQGVEALSKAINSNYVTGTTFNMRCFNERNVLERFDASRGNRFTEDYAHCVMAMITSEKSDVKESGIYLWDAKEEETLENSVVKIQSYTIPENRIIQQNSAVDLMYNAIEMSSEDFLEMFMERVQKTYFLVKLACMIYKEAYMKEYKWIQVCKRIHINNIELVDKYFIDYNDELREQLKHILLQYFIESIRDDFQSNIVDSKEKVLQKTLANFIIYKLENGVSLFDIDVELLEKKIDEVL